MVFAVFGYYFQARIICKKNIMRKFVIIICKYVTSYAIVDNAQKIMQKIDE